MARYEHKPASPHLPPSPPIPPPISPFPPFSRAPPPRGSRPLDTGTYSACTKAPPTHRPAYCTVADEYYSLLAEISESKYRKVPDAKKIIAHTILGYRKANLLPASGHYVASKWHIRKEYGYPVPYVDRDRDVHTADPQLRALGIFSRGRFGGWKYEVGNQDHVCMQV